MSCIDPSLVFSLTLLVFISLSALVVIIVMPLFRFSLWEIVQEVMCCLDRSLVFSLTLLVVTSLSAFSNSYLVLIIVTALFRFSLWELVQEVMSCVDRSLVFSLTLLVFTSLSAFSNSYVVLEARCLNFAVVSLFAAYIFLERYFFYLISIFTMYTKSCLLPPLLVKSGITVVCKPQLTLFLFRN
jgi:hypothetical protein